MQKSLHHYITQLVNVIKHQSSNLLIQSVPRQNNFFDSKPNFSKIIYFMERKNTLSVSMNYSLFTQIDRSHIFNIFKNEEIIQ